MKIRKSPHSTGPAFQPEARHCWPGPAAPWPSRPMPASAARALGVVRGGAVARQVRLHRQPRCSAPGGDSTGERRRLHQARWGGGILTRDDRQRWCMESGLVRRHSKAAAELRWPGRASMSHAARGGDKGGEARSKRRGRRGRGGAHRGRGKEWRGGTMMARWWQSGQPAWT
jgi:hypothetical protein